MRRARHIFTVVQERLFRTLLPAEDLSQAAIAEMVELESRGLGRICLEVVPRIKASSDLFQFFLSTLWSYFHLT